MCARTLTISLGRGISMPHRARRGCVRRHERKATPRRSSSRTRRSPVASDRPIAGATCRSRSSSRRQRPPWRTRRRSERQIELDQGPGLPEPHRPLRVHQPATRCRMLVQEALKAQSTHIYIISGATYTSDAFATIASGARSPRRRRGSRDASGHPPRRAGDGHADRDRPPRRRCARRMLLDRRSTSSARSTLASAPTGTTARSPGINRGEMRRADVHPDVQDDAISAAPGCAPRRADSSTSRRLPLGRSIRPVS